MTEITEEEQERIDRTRTDILHIYDTIIEQTRSFDHECGTEAEAVERLRYVFKDFTDERVNELYVPVIILGDAIKLEMQERDKEQDEKNAMP